MATEENEISRLRHRRDVLIDQLLLLDSEKCGEKSRGQAIAEELQFLDRRLSELLQKVAFEQEQAAELDREDQLRQVKIR